MFRTNSKKLKPKLKKNDYIDKKKAFRSKRISDDDVINEDTVSLIKGCIASNRRSQRALFKKYRKSVFSLCYKMLGPGFDIDDIVQQVFIKIFHSLKSFKGLSSLDTWIYRITGKVCSDQLRKKYRKRRLDVINNSDDLAAKSKSDVSLDPAFQIEKQELEMHIYKALNMLSREKRIVTVMYEMEGNTLEQISEIIQKPIGTVKSRLYHARKELEKHLHKYLKAE